MMTYKETLMKRLEAVSITKLCERASFVVSLVLFVCCGLVPTGVWARDKRSDASSFGERYAVAYRNLVFIHTKNSASTGFKLKLGEKVYLYTCRHCIDDYSPIEARNSMNAELKIGRLELCHDRDLARFELPLETTGLQLAKESDLKVGTFAMAYGDTMGRGVMTQNQGTVLAVGIHKFETDTDFLNGNSGGPVLNDRGDVLGVVSFMADEGGSKWAKDTRYEMIRRFAEKAMGGSWELVPYDDVRRLSSLINDTKAMTLEMGAFRELIDGRKLSNGIIYSSGESDCRYSGAWGYAEKIRAIYSAWNEMSAVHNELTLLSSNNAAFYETAKKRNALLRKAMVSIPLETLRYAAGKCRTIDAWYYQKSRDKLLVEIEKGLIPHFMERGKEVNQRDEEIMRAYEKLRSWGNWNTSVLGGMNECNKANNDPLKVLDTIPLDGATRTFITDKRDSMVQLCSRIDRDCLVEMHRCSAQTNLAYDVFLHAGKTQKVPIASGTYLFSYKVGELWYGYERGFSKKEEFWFRKAHDFTPRKGCTLNIK